MGIRDMVKYDSGVSVVEQGRGGSSGYAIYGVDKNRVAVTVDGVAQSQSYVDETTNSGNTGSMNEVEIANIYAVDIAKDSNGAFVGSGALGGSVEFTTKKASHIIPTGQDHVIKSHTTYTSKDKRLAQTVAGAFDDGKFSGLLQYTKRKGEGVHAHKDAGRGTHTFTRLGSFEEKYDLRSPNTLSTILTVLLTVWAMTVSCIGSRPHLTSSRSVTARLLICPLTKPHNTKTANTLPKPSQQQTMQVMSDCFPTLWIMSRIRIWVILATHPTNIIILGSS